MKIIQKLANANINYIFLEFFKNQNVIKREIRFILAVILFLICVFTSRPGLAEWQFSARSLPNLGGQVLESPSCIVWGQDNIECFARGTDSAVWRVRGSASGWSGWTSLGGRLTSKPSCVSWTQGRIDCFARGTDGAMYQVWRATQTSPWSNWLRHGGFLRGAPSCISHAQNRIDCVVRGRDSAMYHKGWNGTSWSSWANLGGFIKEQPSCVSWGPNRIDCFARGRDDGTYHKRLLRGSWSSWRGLGGRIKEELDCVSWMSNRLNCFARGRDNALWHKQWDGQNWRGWTRLNDYSLKEAPSCATWGEDLIHCFFRDENDRLRFVHFRNGSWQLANPRFQNLASRPVCPTWDQRNGSSRQSKYLFCFWRGADGSVHGARFQWIFVSSPSPSPPSPTPSPPPTAPRGSTYKVVCACTDVTGTFELTIETCGGPPESEGLEDGLRIQCSLYTSVLERTTGLDTSCRFVRGTHQLLERDNLNQCPGGYANRLCFGRC